ncbi:MAG: hypothetical protein ABIP16_03290 [Thermomonas sp.]
MDELLKVFEALLAADLEVTSFLAIQISHFGGMPRKVENQAGIGAVKESFGSRCLPVTKIWICGLTPELSRAAQWRRLCASVPGAKLKLRSGFGLNE